MCLTDDMLKEAGVGNGMHRMMLLNRRNELLQATPPDSPRIPAVPSSLGPNLGSGAVVRASWGVYACTPCSTAGNSDWGQSCRFKGPPHGCRPPIRACLRPPSTTQTSGTYKCWCCGALNS